MDNGAIGFFLFFVILIIIWIFAMGGCVKERNSLGVYEGIGENSKAGRSRWLGRRPHTRGVVKNPVDHPMGGFKKAIVTLKKGQSIDLTA